MLSKCNLCPRSCNVNRLNGQLGFCGSGSNVKIGRAELHHWEEPCVSGKNGSGTVFFSNCNLKCVFCQNHLISQENTGSEISIERLSEVFIELQNKKAHNINLVTPTHYAPQIIDAVSLSKIQGLSIPVLYNTNSYENVDTIRALKGTIDVFLPDLKYFSDKYAVKYSNAKYYFKIASKAIEEMINVTGSPVFDKDGMIQKGVIVRHMMLPGLLFDSKKIIDFLYNEFGNSIYISIMNQYTPLNKASDYPEINKTLNPKMYDSLVDYAISLGITQGFIQEEGSANKSYVPDFNFTL
ncbi:MAG: radical SAM protein [Clostridiaceae bacterium]